MVLRIWRMPEEFKMKIKSAFEKIAYMFTPIKMLSLLVLSIGIVDNITSLLQHATGGITVYESTTLEFVVRIIFIFCGIFGILGNGRTKRIRATIVSFPLLYLASLYLILFIQYHNEILLAFIAMTAIPALWVVLFGDKYE